MDSKLVRHDWPKVRDYFVSESPRPTYESLAAMFSVPVGTLARVAADEGWVDLRVRHQLALIDKSDALAVITAAAKDSTVLSGMAFETIAQILSGILRALADLEKESKMVPRSRMEILNTATFAIQNAGNAARSFGITNLPEALKRAAGELPGSPGNGQWDKSLLQQINVTVNGLQAAQAKQESAAVTLDTKTSPPTI